MLYHYHRNVAVDFVQGIDNADKCLGCVVESCEVCLSGFCCSLGYHFVRFLYNRRICVVAGIDNAVEWARYFVVAVYGIVEQVYGAGEQAAGGNRFAGKHFLQISEPNSLFGGIEAGIFVVGSVGCDIIGDAFIAGIGLFVYLFVLGCAVKCQQGIDVVGK